MERSFFHGLLVGIAAPLLFVRAFVQIVFKSTGQVPFIEKRENALALVLLEPDEAASRSQSAAVEIVSAAIGIKTAIQSYAARSRQVDHLKADDVSCDTLR